MSKDMFKIIAICGLLSAISSTGAFAHDECKASGDACTAEDTKLPGVCGTGDKFGDSELYCQPASSNQ